MVKLLLAKMLEKRKMSKRRFARLIQVDYPSSFRYYRSGYDPKLSTLEMWAKVLDCRIRDLFEECQK